jgi:hypothetical protein
MAQANDASKTAIKIVSERVDGGKHSRILFECTRGLSGY